jgi:GNAT superfamily N-acetyltransferase
MATTEAGDPVAAICLRGWGDGIGARWSIPLVLVDPRFRRGGLAAGLVREALAAAESEGAAVVFAETRSTWEAASTFWSALADRLAD